MIQINETNIRSISNFHQSHTCIVFRSKILRNCVHKLFIHFSQDHKWMKSVIIIIIKMECNKFRSSCSFRMDWTSGTLTDICLAFRCSSVTEVRDAFFFYILGVTQPIACRLYGIIGLTANIIFCGATGN